MNQIARNFILILLLLAALMLPAFIAAGMIELAEEDDLTDAAAYGDEFAVIGDFPISWIRIPVHQMSVFFRLGISIFALFVVYLGGRSKHKRFNDRTINAGNLSIAVFNFQSFTPCLFDTRVSLAGVFVLSNLPTSKEKKL